ncbi:MAG: alkaline shock response membrane anchor protein AmaP [Clostridia bacterium]|nr:alkaline shock response membrane anchor protein AmaP [Clostridia bacterium]
MKIRFWDRLILFLGAMLTMAAGGFLLVGGLQFLGVWGEALPVGLRIGCVVGGILLIVFGGYLFAFPHTYSARRHDFIVQQTDNGELRIAVKAIENLVQKCVDMHEEIQLDSMKIRNAREGVSVDLGISLANNISIPLAVASLQKQIKQYLVASSGIEVKEVRVSVETAGGEVSEAADLSYMEPAAEQAQEKAPDKTLEKNAEQKSKLPLHQRIFGKPEQAANMPEPPKDVETMEPAAEASAQPIPEAVEESAHETPVEENPMEETEETLDQEVQEPVPEEAEETKEPAETEETEEASPLAQEEPMDASLKDEETELRKEDAQ